MRVLLVEDERATARMLAKGLREHAYSVDVAHDGLSASQRLRECEYDIVILDVMIPGRNGLDVCRELRSANNHVLVLMLTARDATESRIDGLDSGADDYITKPFDFRELLARIRALLRRRGVPLAPETLALGPLRIDTATRELFASGVLVPLTAREFALLEFLARRHGTVVSRREIARHVWDDTYDPLSNVIDVYVQRLRRKIDAPGRPSFIRARRGEGYQLLCDQAVTA
jgi:two-component system copper resistance phosphate regulon response regulator CusR